MHLESPSIRYKHCYLQAMVEAKDEPITLLYVPEANQSFDDFIKQLRERARGENLPDGWVPESVYWLVDKGVFIGRVSIRHSLNAFLLQVSGHIGYCIRPLKRKMGYGTAILSLGLQEAKKLGLQRVLVTCDEDNMGSRKIIEKNGGKLENIVSIGEDKPRKRRYWIEIA